MWPTFRDYVLYEAMFGKHIIGCTFQELQYKTYLKNYKMGFTFTSIATWAAFYESDKGSAVKKYNTDPRFRNYSVASHLLEFINLIR